LYYLGSDTPYKHRDALCEISDSAYARKVFRRALLFFIKEVSRFLTLKYNFQFSNSIMVFFLIIPK